VDHPTIAFLASDEGASVVEEVGDVSDADLLPVLERLRRTFSPERAAAIVETARLRRQASSKFDEPSRMLFTADGLQQASGRDAARSRAGGFAGVDRVADLGCGIGGDALALRRVTEVLAVEIDPVTAAIAAHNLAGRTPVVIGDAARPPIDLASWSVFLDPSRRRGSGRVFDPGRWSPPFEVAVEVARSARSGAVKCAPGIPHEALPGGAVAEWVSVGGQLKECLAWFGDGRDPSVRSAVLADIGMRFSGVPRRYGAIAPIGAWLHEPDPAVIRSGLVANLAEKLGLARIDPMIAYLTGDDPVDSPFLRSYPVESVDRFGLKRLRAHLRHLDVGSVTVKKRGSPIPPEELRKRLDLSGSEHRVVIVTRVGDVPTVVIATEPQPSDRAHT